MAREYGCKHGWSGLSFRGKAYAVLIWFIASFLFFFLVPLFDKELTVVGVIKAVKSGNAFFIAIAGAVGFGVAWVAHHFLPKATFYRDEYFCADCGQSLGYSPSTCDRCGCNRYTSRDSGVGRTFRSR